MSGKRTVVEVGALAPLDAKSAKVLGGGIHWTPKLKDDPRFVRETEGALPYKIVRPWIASAPDLTGKRIGRFTVLGLSLIQNPKKKANWVVRCDCGAYEHRKYRALTSVTDDQARMCRHCAYLEVVKRGAVKRPCPIDGGASP